MMINLLQRVFPRIHGLIAATFCPFKANFDVDISKIPQYVDFLLKQGIRHIYVNGTTGEGTSLTVEERKLVAEAWVKYGKDNLDKIIIQVGGTNLRDSCSLASHAQEIGASAVAALPSVYNKPQHIDDLVTYCQQIAESASDLPFYYYHIPSWSNVTFDVVSLFRRISERALIPNLAGMKFTSSALSEALLVKRMCEGRYQVMVGTDDMLLASLAMLGTDKAAAIGSTYNFMGDKQRKLITYLEKGEIIKARKHQVDICDALRRMLVDGISGSPHPLPIQKCAMALVSHVDMGPPRPPYVGLDDAQRTQLQQILDAPTPA